MEDSRKMGLAKFEQLISESCGNYCIEPKEMQELINSLKEVKLHGYVNQLNRNDKEKFIKLLFNYFEIVLPYITNKVTEYSKKIQRSSELLSNAVAPFLKDSELNDIIFDSMLKNLFELVLLKEDYSTPCTLAIFKLIISIADQSLDHPRVQKAASENPFNLLRLADTLGLHGDYVLQLTIIETIIKFPNCVNKEHGYLFFPENPILNKALLAINLDNFDVNVRKLLNEFNEQSSHIFSYPYISIQIGEANINVIKEGENSWIDFNLKEANLSFFVYNESKTLWNRIIIICDHISKVEIKRNSTYSTTTLCMHQIRPCISSISEDQHYWDNLDKMVEINVNNDEPGKFNKLINTILPQLFGNKFMHTSNRIAKSSRNNKLYRPSEKSKKKIRKRRNSFSGGEKYNQIVQKSKSPLELSFATTSWVANLSNSSDNTDNSLSGRETVVSSCNNLAASVSSADEAEISASNVSSTVDSPVLLSPESNFCGSGSEKNKKQDESRRNDKIFSEDSSSSKSSISSLIFVRSGSGGVRVGHISDDEVLPENKLPSSNEVACDPEINKDTPDLPIVSPTPENDTSSLVPERTNDVPHLSERPIIIEEILVEEHGSVCSEKSFSSPLLEIIEAERPPEIITENKDLSPTPENDSSGYVPKRPIDKEITSQHELLSSSKKDACCIHVAEKTAKHRQPDMNSEKIVSDILILPLSPEKNYSGLASKRINNDDQQIIDNIEVIQVSNKTRQNSVENSDLGKKAPTTVIESISKDFHNQNQNVCKRKTLYNPDDFSHLESATNSLEETVESAFLAPIKKAERKKSTKKRTRTEATTKLVRKPKNLNNFPFYGGRALPVDIIKAYDSCVPHLVNNHTAHLNSIDAIVRDESCEETQKSASDDDFHRLSRISRSVLSPIPENENNISCIRILENVSIPSRKRIFNSTDIIEDGQWGSSSNKRSRIDHSSTFEENDRFNFIRGGGKNQDECTGCKM